MFNEVSFELPYFCLFTVSLWLSGTLFEELLRCRLVGELFVSLLLETCPLESYYQQTRPFSSLQERLGSWNSSSIFVEC